MSDSNIESCVKIMVVLQSVGCFPKSRKPTQPMFRQHMFKIRWNKSFAFQLGYMQKSMAVLSDVGTSILSSYFFPYPSGKARVGYPIRKHTKLNKPRLQLYLRRNRAKQLRQMMETWKTYSFYKIPGDQAPPNSVPLFQQASFPRNAEQMQLR